MNKEQIRQYFVAFFLALLFFGLFSLYLFLRRGYYNLFIINKALGESSLALLGIVLLIGPIFRIYDRFDKWVIYRREIGIIAFLLAVAHGVISFSPKISNALFWGIASLLILFILFLTSFNKIIAQIGTALWIKIQSWGIRLAIIFAFFHVVALKYSGWAKWFKVGGGSDLARPGFPPGSLIAVTLIGFVALVRLGEIFGVKTAKIIFKLGLIILIFILIALFFINAR